MMSRKLLLIALVIAVVVIGGLALPRIYAAITPQPVAAIDSAECGVIPLDTPVEEQTATCTDDAAEIPDISFGN